MFKNCKTNSLTLLLLKQKDVFFFSFLFQPTMHNIYIYIYIYFDFNNIYIIGDRSSTVVKVLCYKLEGHWFNPSWCHCNFSLT